MGIYKVRTSDGCRFRMRYTPDHPELPIMVDHRSDGDWEEGARWITTPYQSCEARDGNHAAELVQEYSGDDLTWVKSVERID